ncbi:enoyl-CoA hydratase-related protein [Blastococcus sp. TF02-9]|uniref:enoyl-CoA hydratase-related protein n=1 Tax=Blastococcus sp. TF02-09 TaxID=2250576 RepID=UPI001F18937C|nr:enoyl-CoA hydratase-related protein [Blastococcus sp. TF02-9]
MADGAPRVERDGDVVRITMVRGARRNALSREHLTQLLAAVTEAGGSDATGIVLGAEGPVFSAGHDFADVADAALPEVRSLLLLCTELMQTLQDVPQVVVARVHALATAAGCQLVASCDLAVAAESAGFAAPGGKGGWFCHTPMVAIARNVGRKRAMELALTGDVIDARTALDWGLVNRVVPDAELDAAVDELLARDPRLAGEQGVGQADDVRPAGPARAGRVHDGDRGHGRGQPDPRRPGGDGLLPGEAPAAVAGLTS